MANLLYAYEADRSLAKARRVADYDRKHPMASCLLTPREMGLLADAVALAKTGG